MNSYDYIALIYNPKSTGDAPGIARRLSHDIKGAVLVPTKHAGHAIELAKNISLKHHRALIVSVSGDGGYNEVINGVMQAQKESATIAPVVAVVGAGNANDHRRVMRDATLKELILTSKPKPLDLLRLSSPQLDRYAHSYIGFGLTSEVGSELNRTGKGFFRELFAILKTTKEFEPVVIRQNGRKKIYDNMLFANINEMAKVVKLDNTNTPRDGRFELIAVEHKNRLKMLASLLGAVIFGFKNSPSMQGYSFTTEEPLSVQLDGEVVQLTSPQAVSISSIKHAVESLY
jgi:diacylglycerol kinase (ATP)